MVPAYRQAGTTHLGNDSKLPKEGIMFIVELLKAIFSKFFLGRDGTCPDRDAVLAEIRKSGKKKVLFIDTPPTAPLRDLVKTLLSEGVEVVFRDHHDGEGDSERAVETRLVAESIRQMVGTPATISTRTLNPACSSLINTGEFADEDTFIVADPDADGLTAACKARGLVYEDLDKDAAILDGPHAGQTADTLSANAWLLVQGLATLPPFDASNPAPSLKAKADLFETFARMVKGDEEATNKLMDTVNQFNAMVAEAKALAPSASVLAPNLVQIDIRNRNPHTGTLYAILEKGNKVVVTIKDGGPIANAEAKAGRPKVQYSIAVRKDAQSEIDLRTFKPTDLASSPESGIISNTPFLLHASEKVWNETVLPALKAKLAPASEPAAE